MPGAATNYAEKKIMDHAMGIAAWSMPTTFLALFTADPTETGSQTAEVPTGVGYSRQPLSAALNPTNATTGLTDNANAITFGPATANWGTITHVGVMDAASGGNMLFYGPVTTAKLIQTGDNFQFAANQLSNTVD